MHFFWVYPPSRTDRNPPRINAKLMGGTLLLPLILLFTIIPMVSAFDFDNVKSYDSSTKTLTFKDSLLGIPTTEIATAKLNTPHLNYVIAGKDRLVAEFEVDLKDDTYTDALKSMEFINLRNGKTIQRDFKYKYKTITYKDVDIQEQKCKDITEKNGSISRDCKWEVTGTRKQEVVSWSDAPDKNLKKGKTIIGIFTDVESGDYVEWIPTLFGVRATEWATWTDGLNTNLQGFWKLNETTGTQFNNSVSTTGNMVLSNSHNATGIIGYSYPSLGSVRDDLGYPMEVGTLNFWIQTTNAPGSGYAFITYTTGSEDGCFSLYVSGSNMDFYVFHDGSLPSIKTLAMGGFTSWHMITLALNGTNELIYIDGSLDTYHTGTRSISFADLIYFTGSPTDSSKLGGWNFDEIGLWNRVLSPTEISDLWNSGLGITYTPAAPPTTPIISIDYPTAGSYNYPITHLNVSVTANASAMNCWWSNDSGKTNQSLPCWGNVTTSSKEGSNTWQVWVNDTNGQNTDDVTFTVDTAAPLLTITSPIGETLLTDLLSGTQVTKNLTFNITDSSQNKCWYYFYENKNYTGINISIKMDYGLGTYDPVYCYNFNTNTYNTMTGTIKDNFVSFNIPGVCIDKSRINLKIQGGLNALSEGTAKVYDISLNNTFYNLALINYACENTTSGNVTGCGKGVDQNFATSADFQENGLFGGTAYIYLNYTLGNYTLIGSCGWNTTAISNITLNKNYTVWLFANDTFGNFNFTNTSFIYKYAILQNNMTYSPDTYETSKEDFIFNFTYNTDLYQLTLANLFYNGTKYATTKSEIGGGQVVFNKTLYVPPVPSQQNISFIWQIGLVNTTGTYYVNSSLKNQSVGTINLSSCTDNGTIAWNITMFDEQTKERVITYNYKSTLFYALSVGGNIFKNISWGSDSIIEQRFCISVNKTFYVNGDIQYSNTSLGYDTKIYSPLNYPLTNITTNLFLYSLLAAQSTSFIIHVQNQALMPLEGYTVYVNRWYPETGSYKTVQTVTTNSNGEGVAFLEIEDVEYQFYVYNTNKDLVYISERSVIIPKETPYTIYLTIGDMLPNPIIYMGNLTGLTYSLTFDKTTNDVSFIYTDTNTSFSKARLYVVKKNPKGDVPICNMNNSDPNGVIICDLSGNSTGQYGATAYIYRGKEYFVYNMLFEIETFSDYVGLLGVFGAFLILLVAGFAFAYNEVAGIVSINLAIIFLNIIGIVHFGGVFITAMIAISTIILVVLERG